MIDLTDRLGRAGVLLDEAYEQRCTRPTRPATADAPNDHVPAGSSAPEEAGSYLARSISAHRPSWRLWAAVGGAVAALVGIGIYLTSVRPAPPSRPLPYGTARIVLKVQRIGVTTVLRIPSRNLELRLTPNPAAPRDGTCGATVKGAGTSRQCGRYGENQVGGLFRMTDFSDGDSKADRYLQIFNLDRRIAHVKVRDGPLTMNESPIAGAVLFPLQAPWPDPGFTIIATDRQNATIWTERPR